jgi:hypothetical protein
LRQRLVELGLADNTLLIFATDNGTARGATFTDNRGNDGRLVSGFNAGMRGRKGSPYEGGHRVPCFLHWPAGNLTGGRDVAGLSAHFDLPPTLIDLCGLKPTEQVAYDGISLRDALTGTATISADRLLIAHHQELSDPEKYRFASVMQGSWRLILRNDLETREQPTAELYNLSSDAGQTRNIVAHHAEITARLRRAYDAWWDGISPDFDTPAEIVIGNSRQNPTELTCFEWHSSQQWWQPAVHRGFEGNGYWTIRVAHAGQYEITLRRWPTELNAPMTAAVDGQGAIAADTARLRVGQFDETKPVNPETRAVLFDVTLPAGSTRLETWLAAANGPSRGAYYVSVRRVDSK